MKKLIYAGVLIGLTSIAYAFVSKAPLKPYCVTMRNDKGSLMKFNIEAQSQPDAKKRAEAQYPTMSYYMIKDGVCK
jgi:hypothetical protein